MTIEFIKEQLIKKINKKVKDDFIKQECIQSINENKSIPNSWYIARNYKFTQYQIRMIDKYNFSTITKWNY